jgi:two-component system OmpR family response regulator
MKVFIVEDDARVVEHITRALSSAGHCVESEGDGGVGLARALCEDYAALILDRMLPSLDGLSLVKRLRAAGNDTPVLFLTTMTGIDDRVDGLKGGADDYLVKPFAMTELLARINAMTRRSGPGDSTKVATRLCVADLEMDLIRRKVTRSGAEIDLQPQEFKLLEYLMRNAGRAVTRKMLLENVWKFHFDPRTKIVESHISRLRTKIGLARSRELIHTIRGIGYALRED